ncbi:uncharacterized protein N7482_003122 [Penicillium canariense]|uniref:Uncharacterized protein n=1 Tax=Penicillium canariense TaxID=189055 RepID=A0A9W9LV48_9EURO|nr:uncharacterized protein N7482_003122 [Penicillium canariense]KAJ5177245.1 hypothetical protein N7482_003122 [Penicillium canariense]
MSIGLAHRNARLFRHRQWVTPKSSFNSTNSLHLLLLQSPDSVGCLRLILRGDEKTADATPVHRWTKWFGSFFRIPMPQKDLPSATGRLASSEYLVNL